MSTTESKTTWIIQDTFGNRIFSEKTFESYDGTWQFIQTEFPCNDECINDDCNNCQELQELYAEEVCAICNKKPYTEGKRWNYCDCNE